MSSRLTRLKGLDEQAVEAICQMQPSKIVYVSCDPATLARDIKRFSLEGYEWFAHALDFVPTNEAIVENAGMSLSSEKSGNTYQH